MQRKRDKNEEKSEENALRPSKKSKGKGTPVQQDRAERVRKAIELVKMEKVPIKKAAIECNLTYGFLYRRLSGEVDMDGRNGPNPVFSKEEETEMATWLSEMAGREMVLTPKEVLDNVQKIVLRQKKKTPFKDGRPSYDWYYAFTARNISLRDMLAGSLLIKTKLTEDRIEKWYARFRDFLSSKNLLNRPSQIWNADEIIFGISSKTSKVMGPLKPIGNSQDIAGSSKKCLTTIFCANAEGNMIPPFVVYPESASKGCDLNANSSSGTTLDYSKSGSLTDELFKKFLHHFDKHVGPERPILLLIDSVSTHISIEVFRQAKEYQIELYRIMHNATQLMQPMDVGVFKPLKTVWSKIIQKHYKENPEVKIECHNFLGKLHEAYLQIYKPSTIVESFESCRIRPVDGSVITGDHLKQVLTYTVQEADLNEDK